MPHGEEATFVELALARSEFLGLCSALDRAAPLNVPERDLLVRVAGSLACQLTDSERVELALVGSPTSARLAVGDLLILGRVDPDLRRAALRAIEPLDASLFSMLNLELSSREPRSTEGNSPEPGTRADR